MAVDFAARIRPSGLVRPRPQPPHREPAPDAPVIACRCCGTAMDARHWRELDDHAVTCWHDGCTLRTRTFSASAYPTVDLSRYGVR